MRVQSERTREGLRRLAYGVRRAAEETLQTAATAAETHAQTTTLFRDQTGETRASIRTELRGLEGFVQAGGAAGFLENGTPPHWIGAPVFIRGVGWRFIGEHPGTDERPFMQEARDKAEQVASYAVELYMSQAIARA